MIVSKDQIVSKRMFLYKMCVCVCVNMQNTNPKMFSYMSNSTVEDVAALRQMAANNKPLKKIGNVFNKCKVFREQTVKSWVCF